MANNLKVNMRETIMMFLAKGLAWRWRPGCSARSSYEGEAMVPSQSTKQPQSTISVAGGRGELSGSPFSCLRQAFNEVNKINMDA